MVEIKILKHVGDMVPGEVREVTEETADQLCDGKKAMRIGAYRVAEAVQKDINNLTVKEMRDLGMDNKPLSPDQEMLVKTEEAALAGKPVAQGEPLITTGGITPPTQVYPAMAEAAGHDVTKVDELKVKADDKAPVDKPVVADKKAKK